MKTTREAERTAQAVRNVRSDVRKIRAEILRLTNVFSVSMQAEERRSRGSTRKIITH